MSVLPVWIYIISYCALTSNSETNRCPTIRKRLEFKQTSRTPSRFSCICFKVESPVNVPLWQSLSATNQTTNAKRAKRKVVHSLSVTPFPTDQKKKWLNLTRNIYGSNTLKSTFFLCAQGTVMLFTFWILFFSVSTKKEKLSGLPVLIGITYPKLAW